MGGIRRPLDGQKRLVEGVTPFLDLAAQPLNLFPLTLDLELRSGEGEGNVRVRGKNRIVNRPSNWQLDVGREVWQAKCSS